MAELTQEEHIREYVNTMRQHFATYHNHKENMSYLATTFYITGAGVLLTQYKAPTINKLIYQICMSFVVVILSLIAFFFVKWQLIRRDIANDIVSACDNLRLSWLSRFTNKLNLSPATYKWIVMPQFLADEIQTITSRPSETTILPKMATLTAILIVFCVLVVRILT